LDALNANGGIVVVAYTAVAVAIGTPSAALLPVDPYSSEEG
jgi:hypothetical protein